MKLRHLMIATLALLVIALGPTGCSQNVSPTTAPGVSTLGHDGKVSRPGHDGSSGVQNPNDDDPYPEDGAVDDTSSGSKGHKADGASGKTKGDDGTSKGGKHDDGKSQGGKSDDGKSEGGKSDDGRSDEGSGQGHAQRPNHFQG